MTQYFSVAAMFIMFRECLEASVIVAVLLQLLKRLKMQKLQRQVWLGAAAGLLASMVLGAVFIVIFYVAGNKIFSGDAKEIFKGTIAYIASFLITIVAFAMLKMYSIEIKWRKKLEQSVDEQKALDDMERKQKWSIFFLTGSAVFREGVESVIFLAGVSSGTDWQALPISAIVGISLGLLCGIIVYLTGAAIRKMMWFFIFSCGFLLLIAAGLVSNGTRSLQTVGAFGYFGYNDVRRAWYNRFLWDWNGCCSQGNQFWAMMHALLGYEAQGTALQLMLYFSFWILVMLIFIYKWRTGKLWGRYAGEAALEEAAANAKKNALYDSDDLELGADGKTGYEAARLSDDDGSGGSDSAPDSAMEKGDAAKDTHAHDDSAGDLLHPDGTKVVQVV